MLLKLSDALFVVTGLCAAFLIALFAGMGVPAWVVMLYNFVFLWCWVPFVAAIVLRIIYHLRSDKR